MIPESKQASPPPARSSSPSGSLKLVALVTGAVALAWFILRVIPKPSRAAYPCQRAAFPLATSFVLWLTGLLSLAALKRLAARRRLPVLALSSTAAVALLIALLHTGSNESQAGSAETSAAVPPPILRPTPPATGHYDWTPQAPNQPLGVAQGLYPGRVVWARDPAATTWAGRYQLEEDQWWLDKNTDQARVGRMLSVSLQSLTSTDNDEAAWQALFQFHNRKRADGGSAQTLAYQAGQIVALKINLNNTERPVKPENTIDASPQMVLAMVRSLVVSAHVPPGNIIVFDARRYISPAILQKVWSEYKEVRFVQREPAHSAQPLNPGYGDHHGLEAADWVEGLSYSAGTNYDKARFIPRQILEARYLINLALLKAHSYPNSRIESGNEGQTALTLTGKNLFGAIQGTPELHVDINTSRKGTAHAYSPLVDLAASPNLGAKTLLFVLDGLYCGRKWNSLPLHFPNPPFNNRAAPYENPDWPASVLVSQDGVAIDSVGLDILYSQSKHNEDSDNGNQPRILIRENADDYLHEMATPEQAPSGTRYIQAGQPVKSLGVHEHWNNDTERLYSRNIDPVHGTGIELRYLPLDKNSAWPAADHKQSARIQSTHPLLYAGEWDYRSPEQKLFILRDGAITWSYAIPLKNPEGTLQEWGDVTLLSNGNVLFARKTGAGLVSPDKKLLWNYNAPAGTEVHVIQPLGLSRAFLVQNGNPAKLLTVNLETGAIEKELILPTGNPSKSHGQFRAVRRTRAGTFLAAHMDWNRVAEYDESGKEIWAIAVLNPWMALRLPNGNTLVSSNRGFVNEYASDGHVVWSYGAEEAARDGIQLYNCQGVQRLRNGNTLIANWCPNGVKNPADWPGTVQLLEVSPERRVVSTLRSWTPPTDLGPASEIQVLDEPGLPENGELLR